MKDGGPLINNINKNIADCNAGGKNRLQLEVSVSCISIQENVNIEKSEKILKSQDNIGSKNMMDGG